MRRKCFKYLLLLVVILILVGCNGIRVDNNVYQPTGIGQYVIAPTMEYQGNTSWNYKTKPGGVSSFSHSHTRALVDLFVSSEDGVAKEFVAMRVYKISTGFCWSKLNGHRVQFGGREYIEDFLTVYGSDWDSPYLQAIRDAGYALDGRGFWVRILVRNVTSKTQLMIAYGCSEALVPADIIGDIDAEKAFVVGGFESTIMVPMHEG